MPDTSAPDMSGIDPALLQDFISESQEILDGLDPLFVTLESNPDDMSIVDGIFRPVHSVKGNSGFFGLTNIKNFAHIMENILGEIRARKRQATPPLIDLLLKGVDFLRGMMNRLAQGDYSGRFTPEEEAHLERLNQASSESGAKTDGGPAKTPEQAAERTLKALEKLRAAGGESQPLADLCEAVSTLVRLVAPELADNAAASGGTVSIGFFLGGVEVTGAVAAIEHFIGDLEKSDKEEASCEAFLGALQTIEDAGEKEDQEIRDLVAQIRDDFVTIHDSGIGFDPLMTSLIRERFDAIIGRLEKVEIIDDGNFFLAGENVTDVVKGMQHFVADIQKLERDTAPTDEFLNSLNMLKDLTGGNAPLLRAIEQIQDDFITIHESGIGFDDLMQSLIHDRLITVLSHLERGQAARVAYMLGKTDVSETIRELKTVAAAPEKLEKDARVMGGFAHALQRLGEAAETSGKSEMGMEAAALVADVERLVQSGVGLDERMREMIRERLEKLFAGTTQVEIVPEPPAPAEDKNAAAAQGGQAGGADASKSSSSSSAASSSAAPAQGGGQHQELSGKTLRVAEEKVDHFMSFVGELIITGEVFAYIQKKLEQYPEVRQVAQEFKNANLAFGELSTNLQKSLMEVRRVPLKSVLQKLHRIIRDTAAALGKKIDLEITGEDVQIDKSLLEGLESPLVHMVRNSADHGVETPEERKAAGKSETGHVWITASATEEQFTLAIKDDGKGLDVEAIKAKAVSRGMMTEEAARMMPDKDAFRLIFNAGLSTAKVVTDVSGRGVGMDVVLSNLTKMNGNITVDSVKGQGSTFTILLPMTVTLTVIDGLVARVGDQFYIIPLSDVRESVKPSPESIHVIRGTQEVLNVRGELHPIVRLHQVLGVNSGQMFEKITEATAVLVQGKRGMGAAFMVDELIGQQSVVVKDLGKEFENIRCLQGGSILGDGRVGLVLSVQGILVDLGLAQPEDQLA